MACGCTCIQKFIIIRILSACKTTSTIWNGRIYTRITSLITRYTCKIYLILTQRTCTCTSI
jgi:hypothetical protein